MGHALFIGFFLLGAGVIALWFSFRFPTIEPATLGRITVHLGASLLLLALVPVGTGLVTSVGDAVELRLVAIFAVVFPALVYALLVGVWAIKIAQAAFGGGR